MTLTYGELFAGYGGLGMGLQSVLGGEMAWCAEYDKGPSKILATRWPTVPNFGDVTRIDWTKVPKVDVITGGSPCQDLSTAGNRAGMKAGTRSGLWSSMCEAIEIIRPSLVVWENVKGALSGEATSGMESCAFCVGDNSGPTLRALGRVLGDLAEIGYDASWYGLRAADVGAAHGRFRVFVFAHPRHDQRAESFRGLRSESASDRGDATFADAGGQRYGGREVDRGLDGLESDAHRPFDSSSRTVSSDRSAPTLTDSDGSLPVWPMPARGLGVRGRRSAPSVDVSVWGPYAAAIERWELILGREAPAPTSADSLGRQRLSATFVEWLMGLPAGHVTDVKISRAEQLKALGNGVVPQQAAAAARLWLSRR